MKDLKGMTVKQRLFVRELIKTLSPTEAAFRAYNCKDRLVARNIASENLAKLGIELEELMERMGLSLEKDMEDLKRLRDAQRFQVCDVYVQKDKDGKWKINENKNSFIEIDDNHTQLKALELTFKLKKKLQDKTVIDKSKHTHYTTVVNQLHSLANGKIRKKKVGGNGSRLNQERSYGLII